MTTPPNSPDSPAPDLTPEQQAEVDALLQSGRKIEAIKVIREATNRGLAEAKDFADQRAAALHAKDPASFPDPAARKGCLGMLLLCAAGIAALLFGAARL